jgi:hypothetical protein
MTAHALRRRRGRYVRGSSSCSVINYDFDGFAFLLRPERLDRHAVILQREVVRDHPGRVDGLLLQKGGRDLKGNDGETLAYRSGEVNRIELAWDGGEVRLTRMGKARVPEYGVEGSVPHRE